MKLHPFAELFPPLDEAGTQKLADDIARNGLQQPIWTLNGQILDGRNRWNACQIAKVEPRTLEYRGDDPLGFVVSLNLHRRQLTPSQLAIIGVELEAHRSREAKTRRVEKCRELASLRPRDPRGRLAASVNQVTPIVGGAGDAAASRDSESARQVAKELGVNHDYISKAKRIVRDAPELVDLVKSGELGLRDAILLVKVPKHQREQILSRLKGPHDIRKAIAEAKAKLPNPEDRPRAREEWVAGDELVRLRDCFRKVLAGYVNNSSGKFESLVDCVRELEVELDEATRT